MRLSFDTEPGRQIPDAQTARRADRNRHTLDPSDGRQPSDFSKPYRTARAIAG
jgi:hypothetical protein